MVVFIKYIHLFTGGLLTPTQCTQHKNHNTDSTHSNPSNLHPGHLLGRFRPKYRHLSRPKLGPTLYADTRHETRFNTRPKVLCQCSVCVCVCMCVCVCVCACMRLGETTQVICVCVCVCVL